MNKLIMPMVAISVGFLAQYAAAAEKPVFGTSMTEEQLTANNCTAGYIRGGCIDPVYWSIYDGWTDDDCNEWMSVFSCSQCKKGYELSPYTCIPDNEAGTWYANCMPSMMSDDQKADAIFAYTCQCSDLFGETGVNGYLFRGCYTSSIEYKCDTGNKYYQSGTSIKCTVTTDSNGDFKFSRCTGCVKCNEDGEFWESSNTGYQRSYNKKLNVNGNTATCDNVYNNKWRCAGGYYGTSTNGTSGCNKCPTLESVGLTPVCNNDACPYVSSPAGATQITQCYAGTWEPDLEVYLKDSTGKFHWMVEDDTITTYGECNYK